jgi:hypothetical protein
VVAVLRCIKVRPPDFANVSAHGLSPDEAEPKSMTGWFFPHEQTSGPRGACMRSRSTPRARRSTCKASPARSGQEHHGRIGTDAAHRGCRHGSMAAARTRKRRPGIRSYRSFQRAAGRHAPNDIMRAGYFSTASTDVTTKVCNSPSSSLIDTFSPGAKACMPKRTPASSFSAAPGPYLNVHRACSAPPGL